MGVRRLSTDEMEARDKRQKEWRQNYNAKPEVKEYQKEWHKKNNQTAWTKEAHRRSQARYRITAKGKACDVRAWIKYGSKTKDNKEDNNNRRGISV